MFEKEAKPYLLHILEECKFLREKYQNLRRILKRYLKKKAGIIEKFKRLAHCVLLNFQYKVQLLPEYFLMPLLWSFPG
ncbi:MAG: hypothetical protein DRI28_05755 [Caldiserica bacterium]|nr:MAG: hypothetical protein DRI28_05755 [Caldisericota bacterium]